MSPERTPSQDDVEEIPFNPLIAAGRGQKKVKVFGREAIIHHTNNFRIKFGMFYNLRSGELPPGALEEYFRQVFKEHHFEDIFQVFEEKYPKLYKKMVETAHRHNEIKAAQNEIAERYGLQSDEYLNLLPNYGLTAEEADLEDYYFSMAFDGAVPIALSIDPEFDTTVFTR
ncbi:hypothetical protein HY379_00715 [Candidatus Saccharibacteria bacterium]|nr:hypothetical protein [Candidatus Saccharibacteria bacterium]